MNILTCFSLVTTLVFPVNSATIPAVNEDQWKTRSPDTVEDGVVLISADTDEVEWMRSPRVRMIE